MTGKPEVIRRNQAGIGSWPGGSKGVSRGNRKPLVVNADFSLFGWSASIPFDQKQDSVETIAEPH